MKSNKLTGQVLFGNILKPKKYNMGQNKFVDDPSGTFNLTIIMDESSGEFSELKRAYKELVDEIKTRDAYKKLTTPPIFSVKIKSHTDKDGAAVIGKKQVSLKRNAINSKHEVAQIDIYNQYGQPYEPLNDIGYGSKVQVMYSIYDNYIAKDNKWYVTLCLLAVLIEEEASSSYNWDIKQPDVSQSVAQQFDGEVVENQEDTKGLPF